MKRRLDHIQSPFLLAPPRLVQQPNIFVFPASQQITNNLVLQMFREIKTQIHAGGE